METSHHPRISNPLSAILFGSVLLSGAATGATITGVTIEDVSTELTATFNRAASYLVDGGGGAGFDEVAGTHTVTPDGSMWLNNGTFTAPNDPNAPGAVVTFDLGGNYDLGFLTVWNYNEFLAGRPDLLLRGANEVQILVSASEVGPFTSLGNFNLTAAPGVDNVDFGQDIDVSSLTGSDDVRLVRFNILSNHGGDNNFVGLSEVRFDGVLIPEPATALLAVFGLAGVFIRRR